ncbi:putative oxidoreductase family, C-terminal alpha/beta domain [Lyophyllum shimeji]|uniref:Oxidoreductase family, C-terminal alpha/beta domain n=1 Tax=Lyophyllum shimeji TaxID=47721 RepID=A0A9P3PP54_LYOSH|nr:putative oxidoreductase family, C-terminal alpha/beta domain [Lyophyllum shimeji]
MSSGIAILGAGIFAKEAHLPSLAALGHAAPVLKAVYSRSEKSAHDLADAAAIALRLTPPAVYHDGDKSTDLDALLARSDIDAVIVVLPITLQPSVILKALAAGKHVLSEKPVAPDVAQGLGLIQTYNTTYKAKGLIWRVAENFEAEPGFRAAAAAIASGKIGKVIFFRTVVCNYIDKDSKWYKTPWRTVPDYQGGFLLDGGVHTIAALRIMLPHRLTHLSGFASLNKDYLEPHDTINAIVRAGDNFHGTAELTWASPTKSRPVTDGFVITGTDGWLSVNQVTIEGANDPVLRITVKSVIKAEGKGEVEKEEIIEEPVQGVKAELASFFDAIAGKDALNIGEPLEALRDVAFIQAALNSNGSVVDLAELAPSAL